MKKEKIYKKIVPIIFFSVVFLLFNFSRANGQSEQSGEVSTYKISPKILNADLYKKDGNYEVKGLEMTIGEFNYQTDYKNWKGNSANGKVVSFKNIALGYFVVNYNLAPIYCSDGVNEKGEIIGGCEEVSEGNLLVQMPYFPNGKSADIYDPSGKKVLTIDLTSKATCNENDKCDRPFEDSENCPQDCQKQEPKIDPIVMEQALAQQKVQQEAAQAEDGKISFSDVGWGWVVMIVFILALAGGLGYYVYRKNIIAIL
jgi:hypothetical protein